MGWQETLKGALSELRQEEARLSSELIKVRNSINKISTMTGSTQKAGGRGRPEGKTKAKAKRKLSAEGRAAISKAAKARWARHRAAQKSAKKAGS